jgi:hypothetical protein
LRVTLYLNQPLSPLLPLLAASSGPASLFEARFLPLGLSLNATTGAIEGVPTVASNIQTYTVTAKNDGGEGFANLHIEVIERPPLLLAYANASALVEGAGENITANMSVVLSVTLPYVLVPVFLQKSGTVCMRVCVCVFVWKEERVFGVCCFVVGCYCWFFEDCMCASEQ